MKMKKAIIVLSAFLALAACNTVEGLGEDIADGARAVDRAL